MSVDLRLSPWVNVLLISSLHFGQGHWVVVTEFGEFFVDGGYQSFVSRVSYKGLPFCKESL